MGITIDKAIKMLEEIIDEGWLISDLEKCPAIDSCELAIDIMRKYQKIQDIVNKWDDDENAMILVSMIKEAMEDGKA